MTPPIGRLSHRLNLQSLAANEWQTLASVWGSVRDTAGNEDFSGDGLVQRKKVEVVIRHRTGVHAGMRFVLGDRVLDIRAALDKTGRRRFLTCLCEEEPDR